MTASILTIVAALVTFGIWMYKRKVAKDSSPEEKRDEIHKAIADRNQTDINLLVDDAVRLRSPNSPSNPGKPRAD